MLPSINSYLPDTFTLSTSSSPSSTKLDDKYTSYSMKDEDPAFSKTRQFSCPPLFTIYANPTCETNDGLNRSNTSIQKEPYYYESVNYRKLQNHKWLNSLHSNASMASWESNRIQKDLLSPPDEYYSSQCPKYDSFKQNQYEGHTMVSGDARASPDTIHFPIDTNPYTRISTERCREKNLNKDNVFNNSLYVSHDESSHSKRNDGFTRKLKEGSIQCLLTRDDDTIMTEERNNDKASNATDNLQDQMPLHEQRGSLMSIPMDNILCSVPKSMGISNNSNPPPSQNAPSSTSCMKSPPHCTAFASSMINPIVSPGSCDGSSNSSSISSLRSLYVPNRRGRKNMNFTKEEKRLRNRQAVRKCREKQATRRDFLENKIRYLESENEALRRSIQTGSRLFSGDPNLLAKGQHLDILTRLKMTLEEGTANDLVLSSKTIWETQAMLLLCLPCRTYTGHQMIEEFWKHVTVTPEHFIRSRASAATTSISDKTEHSALFFSWIFQLCPKRRYRKFELNPVPNAKNLYIGVWETDTIPVLSGASYYLMGEHSRIQLQIESFGWLVWKLLLSETLLPSTMQPAVT